MLRLNVKAQGPSPEAKALIAGWAQRTPWLGLSLEVGAVESFSL